MEGGDVDRSNYKFRETQFAERNPAVSVKLYCSLCSQNRGNWRLLVAPPVATWGLERDGASGSRREQIV